MKWTVADIRRSYERTQHPCHYFDRSTMKFFGQKMRDFRVIERSGRVYIYAPSKHGGHSLREFLPDTGALVYVPTQDQMALLPHR